MSDERQRQRELFRHPIETKTEAGSKLVDAIQGAGVDLEGAIGLLYTPHLCVLAKVTGERLVDHCGIPVANDAFEARIFNERWELRWLQTGMDRSERLGRAVLVGEAAPPGCEAEPTTVEPLEREYILWGQGDGVAKDGWSLLSLARIGPLWVPITGIERNDLVRLTAREFVARDRETGNAYIADERLTGLSRLAREKSNA